MRIISLWQPWASAVAMGLKGFETRSWSTNYQGLLVIHAAKRSCKIGEMTVLLEDMSECGKELEFRKLEAEVKKPSVYGAVIAVCNLTNCKQMIDASNRRCSVHNALQIDINKASCLEKSLGNWSEFRYAWQLENVLKLESIPFKGSQGLRTVSKDLETCLKTYIDSEF